MLFRYVHFLGTEDIGCYTYSLGNSSVLIAPPMLQTAQQEIGDGELDAKLVMTKTPKHDG